ncbi:hypothetical protein [Erythrobacter sp. BLCC-B19]|uniref:hypothetical protein n=1 Tax=Erythrobacter sp. BLCC-B19 TaxID=3025315 RepID=UPI0023628196|nr:hypothetical protein [Erythrobacter sp. BLCC-B19]WDA42193.1 hypothetical protein PS060_05095 [Erythrobacter sp. BLCC-B19]
MYKAVFQNSKAALAFAAMILFSAFSMVGTSEDAGLVTRAADTFGAERDAIASEAQAYAESRSQGDQPSQKKSPWDAEPNVFGDYTPADEAAAKQAAAKVVAPKGPPPPGYDLMTAPLSSDAVVLESGQTGVPVITERDMTIEPE